MKKIFSPRRNALLSATPLSWGGGVLLFACAMLLLRLLAPNMFWSLTTPLLHASDAFSSATHSFFQSFGERSSLSAKNEALTAQNASLTLENTTLREALGAIHGLGNEGQGIVAGVLVRPPVSPYDTLILSAGTRSGVAAHMSVFGAGGIPLGFISDTTKDFSRAVLFSAPGVVVAGWVGSGRIPLTLKGIGGGAFSATLPRAARITEGDLVYVPGPGTIPVGTVKRIDSDPASPAVTLQIAPAINLFSITWVLVRPSGNELLGAFASSTLSLP